MTKHGGAEPEPATTERTRPRPLREDIVREVEELILGGVWKPGQRLVERELVARFGVSSIPVREALQELETRGLVTKRHNHGCAVVELSDEQFQRGSAVRRLLEPTVIGWAAAALTAEQAGPLEERLAALVDAAAARDVPRFFRQDMLLHKKLWELSGNEFATRALEATVGSLFATSLIRTQESHRAVDLADEVQKHTRLVRAVLAKDVARAVEIAGGIADTLERITIVPRVA